MKSKEFCVIHKIYCNCKFRNSHLVINHELLIRRLSGVTQESLNLFQLKFAIIEARPVFLLG